MEYVIKGVQFGVWSAEDISRQAVMDLTDTGIKGNLDSFTDGLLGSVSAQSQCKDCRQPTKTCTGHWGVIRLGCIIPNPFFTKEIKNILQCFCLKCSTLLYEKNRIELNDLHLLDDKDRLQEIVTILSKSNGSFSCPNCSTPVNEIQLIDDKAIPLFKIRYCDDPGAKKKKNKTLTLSYDEIYGMFKNISNEDLDVIGFNSHLLNEAEYLDSTTFTHSMMRHRHQNRPEDFFITNLPVLPLPVRTAVCQGKETRHDGATIVYQQILKQVRALRDAKNEDDANIRKKNIQQWVFLLYKQKGDSGNQKSYNSLNERLSSKDGHVRGAVESKRADYGGRTVVGNAPHLPFGMVQVPREMAKMSQIEYACNINLSFWNKQLQEDKKLLEQADKNLKIMKERKEVKNKKSTRLVTTIHLVRKPLVNYEPVIQYVTKKTTGFKTSVKFVKQIENGDIIHRLLKTGDMCIINRQPTIRKESYNAHRIYICPDPSIRTLCIPLSDMSSYNMDCDGDEGNIHIPQGPKCQAEMEIQMNIESRIMTDQTSTHVINLTQGVIYCLYLLTRDTTFVPWHIFCDLVFIVGAENTWKDTLTRAEKHFKIDRKEVLSEEKFIGKKGKNVTYELKIIKCDIPGKIVFSLLLPATYSRKIGEIEIERGILIKGQLNKDTMNRITEDLYIEYGQEIAINYINGANFLSNKWNTIYGYTFGLRDCRNYKTKEIKKTLKETYEHVKYIETMPISDDEKEILIREALDKATQIGQKIAKDGMYGGADNAMSIATLSKAKGSFVNLSYISCFLGLQTVMGKRYAPELCEGTRILACFDVGDKSPQAGGFVDSNFYRGLSPIHLFFHAWSSRKGLVDTAVTTKDSGYTHRKFGKKMENAHIDILGCIRDCDNSIIDFQYGEMGFDPGEVYWTHGTAFFIDLKQLVSTINDEYMMKYPKSKPKKTQFSDKQFEFIEKHLLIVGQTTAEPIIASKKRILHIIKQQLKDVEIIIDKWTIETFFARMRTVFNRSRIQPGNMVGFKATCSIGSVSTQDALNAFHSSGTSSKTTTTGLPREEELTSLTDSQKVTGGSFRYNDKILLESDGMTEEEKIEQRKKKMKRIDQLRKIFEYKTIKQFMSIEILKTSKKSVTNEWEPILSTHSLFKKPEWFDIWLEMTEKEITFEDDFILHCRLDKRMMFTYGITLYDFVEILSDYTVIPSPSLLCEMYIYPNFEDVQLPKEIDGESPSWKYYWIRDVCVPQILSTRVTGIHNIAKIFFSHENIIEYQGHNFKELMKIPNVIFSSLQTDVVWEVVENLGISATYIFLYEEFTKCLSKQLNPAHIMLLARTMTDSGQAKNVTRTGIDNRVGVLTKASFETPVDIFTNAASWGLNDDNKSLAASYFLGTSFKIGTLYDNFTLLNRK